MDTHLFVFICMGGLARKGIMREDEAFLGKRGEIDSRWNRCDEKTEEETESGKKEPAEERKGTEKQMRTQYNDMCG